MLIALLNDTHFGSRQDSERIAKHQKKFYDDVFFPYLAKHNIENVIHLGDVFDRRKFINFQTLDRARKMLFDPAAEAGLNIYMIVGNHDVALRNSNRVNSPKLLLTYHNITLWDENPATYFLDGLKVGFVPWICEENQQEVKEFLEKTDAGVIFGHFDINGFEMMPGVICEEGLDPNIFKRFNTVITGHYHTKASSGNIHYLGVQYQMDWGDYGSQKGFHVFDTDTLKLTFVPNPHEMFIKLFYDDKSQKPNKDLSGKYLKIIVKDKKDSYKLEKYIDAVLEQHPEDLQVLEQDITVVEESTQSEEGMTTKSTVTILKEFVNKLNGITDEAKVKVDSVLQDLYSEAQDVD